MLTMKRSRSLAACRLILALAALATPVAAGGPGCLKEESAAAAATEGGSGFDILKGLVGEWEGTGSDGGRVTSVFRLTAAGSAIEETLVPGAGHEMVTMYHEDGARLMLTHYCAAGNQPRMTAQPVAAGATSIAFSLLDATNLAKPTDPHMRALVLVLEDPDHITERWTFSEEGKDSVVEIRLARKKG